MLLDFFFSVTVGFSLFVLSFVFYGITVVKKWATTNRSISDIFQKTLFLPIDNKKLSTIHLKTQ